MVGNRTLCVLAAAAWCAGAQQSVALSDLIRSALERNRELQSLRRRIDEAQALLRQAGVRLAPTLEVEGATGRPLGSRGEEEYSAAWSYPIETAGKRDKRIELIETEMTRIDAAADAARAWAELERAVGGDLQ